MYKDFDGWNEQKKGIHANAHAPLYREREIRWCHFGTNVGFEQDGTGEGRARPALVLKAFNRHVCLVLPLTTSTKQGPYRVDIGVVGDREAAVIISQLRLVDTKRLEQRIAVLDKRVFGKIRKAVKAML